MSDGNEAVCTHLATSFLLNKTMRITIKHKRDIKRRVELELGFTPPKTKVFKNKKKYTRKKKHKTDKYG